MVGVCAGGVVVGVVVGVGRALCVTWVLLGWVCRRRVLASLRALPASVGCCGALVVGEGKLRILRFAAGLAQ